jgi:alcohol dehydrogenase
MKGTSLPTCIDNERCNKLASQLHWFDHQPLGRVIFQAGGLARLGEVTRELGGQRILLVTDPGLQRVGHASRAEASLRQAGLEVFVFDQVEENPETHHVNAGTEFARHHRIDTIVAVGGGSSMDCAKGINFLYTNGGKMADYRGKNRATKPMLPSVGVPTTAGTGSEAQSYALITDESTHLKMACGDKKAAFRVTILDPELTISQPPLLTAVTGIDAITHAIESFVCTARSPLSQMYSLNAWKYLHSAFETVLAEPTNLPARAAMQLGAHFAGMAIEASMLGVAHSCANPLTAHYGTTHGIAVGIMLPHVIRFNAHAVNELYAELAGAADIHNGEPPAEALARYLTRLLRTASLPTTLSECGVSEGILHLLAEEASTQWTARFNPRPVSEADLLRLYEQAL